MSLLPIVRRYERRLASARASKQTNELDNGSIRMSRNWAPAMGCYVMVGYSAGLSWPITGEGFKMALHRQTEETISLVVEKISRKFDSVSRFCQLVIEFPTLVRSSEAIENLINA